MQTIRPLLKGPARALALILFFIIGLGPATPAVRSAGLTVFDPTNYANALNAFRTATDQLKVVKDSFGVVTQTLSEVRSVVRQGTELLRFLGDPRTLLAALGVSQFLGEIQASIGQIREIQNLGRRTIGEVAGIANEFKSLTDAGSNMFGSGRALGLTTFGTDRNTRQYRPFAIIETSYKQADDADKATKAKEQELMKQLEEVTRKAKSATTQTEVQALQAQVQTLQAALNALRAHASANHQAFQSATMAADSQRKKEDLIKDEDHDAAVTAATREFRRRSDQVSAVLGFQ